jgi:hypothetical protein
MQILAITVSILALTVSAITAWLTLFRRGTVKMTRPSVLYFGPDGGPKLDRKQKVYLRTLLFSTSRRGRIIEAMYVSLRRDESRQNFSIWVYGDERLVRGSGLYVGESGVTASHHFMPPENTRTFEFSEGTYHIEVFMQLLGDKQTLCLFSDQLHVDGTAAKAIANEDRGLYFDWGPDAGRYIPHIDKKREPLNPEDFLKALAIGRTAPTQQTSDLQID